MGLRSVPKGFCKGSIADQLGPKSDAANICGGALQSGKNSCHACNRASDAVANTCDAPWRDTSCVA